MSVTLRPPTTTEHSNTAKPFAGLVRWFDGSGATSDPAHDCSLEFFHLTPKEVSRGPQRWDFTQIVEKLRQISVRGRKAVIRLSYQVQESTLELPDYLMSSKFKEPAPVGLVGPHKLGAWVYPSWRSKNFVKFYHEFIEQTAQALDGNPGLAFIQGYVGHWSEGHVWQDGIHPEKVMKAGFFPTPDQYRALLTLVIESFVHTRTLVGISAGDALYWSNELQRKNPMLNPSTGMGTFEDTFCTTNPDTLAFNTALLDALGRERWKSTPRGGEGECVAASQEKAVKDPGWVKDQIRRRHMTFALAHSALLTSPSAKEINAAYGYNFVVTMKNSTTVEIKNSGAAPIYYPTYVFVGSTQVGPDLQTLLPAAARQVVDVSGLSGVLRLICVRISTVQEEIPYTQG